MVPVSHVHLYHDSLGAWSSPLFSTEHEHTIKCHYIPLICLLLLRKSRVLHLGGDCPGVAVLMLQSAWPSLCWAGNLCSAESPASTSTPCTSLKPLAKGTGLAEGSWWDVLGMFSNWKHCVTDSRGDVTQNLVLGCVYKSIRTPYLSLYLPLTTPKCLSKILLFP